MDGAVGATRQMEWAELVEQMRQADLVEQAEEAEQTE